MKIKTLLAFTALTLIVGESAAFAQCSSFGYGRGLGCGAGILQQSAVLGGDACGLGAGVATPAMPISACLPRRPWFVLSVFGFGLRLGGRRSCGTAIGMGGCGWGGMNAYSAVIPATTQVIDDNAACPVVEQPAVIEQKPTVLKTTEKTTKSYKRRVLWNKSHKNCN